MNQKGRVEVVGGGGCLRDGEGEENTKDMQEETKAVFADLE